MTINNFYPWQEAQWQTLTKQTDRLPHAILLHGKEGIGKRHFAHLLSQRLLCDQVANNLPCQTCPKCLWFQEGTHPDFIELTPEDSKTKTGKKTNISVEQVRTLIDRLGLTNHSADSLRIVLVHPADRLNQASANALLKVLEEPPNNTLFILVTSHLQKLLPTIISRCQKVALPMPDKASALTWLETQSVVQPETLLAYSGGSPLTALALHDAGSDQETLLKSLAHGAKIDIFATASHLTKLQMEEALNVLQKWSHDLMLNYNALHVRYHEKYANALQGLAKSVNLSKLLQYERALLQAKQTAQHPLNQELQLIKLLQQYQSIFKH